MNVYNFVRGGRNFTTIFFNAEKIVFVNAVWILPLTLSVPEIFAVKLKSCRKKYLILDVFCPPKF